MFLMPIKDVDKNREYQLEWYHQNKGRLKDRIKDRRYKNKRLIDDYKEELGCVCYTCNKLEHPSALDFHHLNEEEKEYTVSKMAGYKWEKIEQEIKKCILLCACCHRKLHKGLISLL